MDERDDDENLNPRYVYLQSEAGLDYQLWTVGHYGPAGVWVPESDHETRDAAAARVSYLNGVHYATRPVATPTRTPSSGLNYFWVDGAFTGNPSRPFNAEDAAVWAIFDTLVDVSGGLTGNQFTVAESEIRKALRNAARAAVDPTLDLA